MATTTLSGNILQKILVELAPRGAYPLSDLATPYKPQWKEEPITRVNFIDYDGASAVCDDVTGGITGTAYVTTSDRAWTLYRANWPLRSTSTDGTGLVNFWRENGLDEIMYRIGNEKENQAISTLAAAATAGTIYTANTKNVSTGVDTTLDAMTAAQRVAYFNYLFTLLKTKTKVLPDRLIVPVGYASTFLNDLQMITITASGAAVTVQTGVKILPEVYELYNNIVEDAALTYSGFPGARTSAATLYSKKAAILMSSKQPCLEYAEWNQRIETGRLQNTLTDINILELNCGYNLQYVKPVAYLTLAWT